MKRPNSFFLLLISLFLGFSALTASAQSSSEPDKDMKRQLDILEFKYDVMESGNFKLVFKVGDEGRTQMVIVFSKPYAYEGIRVREVRSIANKYDKRPPADVMYAMLEDNAKKKFGAWEINEDDGTWYIAFSARIPADASDAKLTAAFKMVTEAADEMEQRVANGDDW